MPRKHRLKLTPYPAELVLNLDQSPFKQEQWADAIGLTSRAGSILEININLENDKMTQLEALVHEIAHSIDLLQELVSTSFDRETRAYWH